MVGRSMSRGYRACANFLSPGDYFRSGRYYARNPVRAIVTSCRRLYHRPQQHREAGRTFRTQETERHRYMKIVALVLAGGEGSRLYPLTAEHSKPALHFASGYRIIDFVLSNLVNSRIDTLYVLAQYKPHSLIEHISQAWAPWFAGSQGLIKVLLPRSNTLGGQFKGTADAVYQYL